MGKDSVSKRIRYWKGLHYPNSTVLEDIALQTEKMEEENRELQESLFACREYRRHSEDIVNSAHQACDRAGISGLPGGKPMLLVWRIRHLQHQREKAERQRDELFDVAKSLNECCEIEDCVYCSEEPGKCSGDRASDTVERLKACGLGGQSDVER